MDPVLCGSCGARFPVKDLTEDDYRLLREQYYYHKFAEELKMLLKVQEYYRRHPEAEGQTKTYIDRLLESDDPEVIEKLCTGVPFDQIELPPEQPPVASADMSEYPSWCCMYPTTSALGPRMSFVSQEVARLEDSVGAVPCPRCNVGRLYVPSENWNEFTARDAITWYWPEWYGLDGDGTLHVKSSGWQGEEHWTGETTINPDRADYDFWRWLVVQKKYHRLVDKTELPAIRDEWSRRSWRRAN
jgi:hypothetical protein